MLVIASLERLQIMAFHNYGKFDWFLDLGQELTVGCKKDNEISLPKFHHKLLPRTAFAKSSPAASILTGYHSCWASDRMKSSSIPFCFSFPLLSYLAIS